MRQRTDWPIAGDPNSEKKKKKSLFIFYQGLGRVKFPLLLVNDQNFYFPYEFTRNGIVNMDNEVFSYTILF